MTELYGGVDRITLESAVRDGLQAYHELAMEGGFELIRPGVKDLRISEPGGYVPAGLLSSQTTVISDGIESGLQLDMVVLRPGEGTGRYGGEHSRANYNHGLYLDTHKVIPPIRTPGTIEAVILGAAFKPEGGGRVLHANRLEAVGLVGHTAVQLAEIGQNGPEFHKAMLGRTAVDPQVEMTLMADVGHLPKIGPWALFNNTTCTQIVGLLHTTGGGKRPLEIFEYLDATTRRTLASDGVHIRAVSGA